jgi:glucosamine kinase
VRRYTRVSDSVRVLIGVDAGGSRTTAAVADANGTVLVRAEGAPGAMRPGDAAGAAARIVDTCRDALVKAERAVRGDVLVVGAAGTGREAERLALQSAFGGGAGIVLIAGTGSIAWGRLPGGETVRAGGLGPALGDHGSGHDLGRGALRAAGLALDGMGPRTALTERLLRHLHVGGVDDLVAWTGAASVQAVAALAAEVLVVAEEGDAVAAALADAGADALARHVAAVAARFPGGQPVPVALGGGLLARSDAYRKRVVARILVEVGSADVRPATVDAVLGAIHLARML